MNCKLKILDCTLRDGGYCNNWQFGKENIENIIHELSVAGVDYIEFGMLSDKTQFDMNRTVFNSINCLSKLSINSEIYHKLVILMNYGDYDVRNIPDCSNTGINGIRVAFHKPYLEEAFKTIDALVRKNYRVYLQPMVTNYYSNQELIYLIDQVNEYPIESLYIVDSFGSMKKNDIERLVEVYEEKLRSDIMVGLHSHNNLDLALSNSLLFQKKMSKHSTIVDATIMGMGRGAGNLDIEEFIEKTYKKESYDKELIEKLRNNIISKIYEKNKWGISPEYYLSALYGCHPNYAKLLSSKNYEKNVLRSIFASFEEGKKTVYDESYVQEIIKLMEGNV